MVRPITLLFSVGALVVTLAMLLHLINCLFIIYFYDLYLYRRLMFVTGKYQNIIESLSIYQINCISPYRVIACNTRIGKVLEFLHQIILKLAVFSFNGVSVRTLVNWRIIIIIVNIRNLNNFSRVALRVNVFDINSHERNYNWNPISCESLISKPRGPTRLRSLSTLGPLTIKYNPLYMRKNMYGDSRSRPPHCHFVKLLFVVRIV